MDELARSRWVSRWSRALATTSAASVPAARVDAVLAELVDSVDVAMSAASFDAAIGVRVGAGLASLGFSSSAVPQVSTRVLHEMAECGDRPDAGLRMVLLAAAIGQGHRGELGGEAPVTSGGGRPLTERVAEAPQGELFRVAFDNVAVAIGIADTTGGLVEVNQCLADSVGLPVGTVRGMSIFDFAHPEEVADIRRLVDERLLSVRRGTVRTESRVVRADGHVSWLACSITYVRGLPGESDFLLAVGQDITERHRLQEELRWQSRHDSLTGLPNRRYLLERIERIAMDAETADRVGLCFVDVDEFKEINDRYGHQVGDRVLVAVASRLRECCAAAGYLVARIGGDEFVVLVPPPVDDGRIAAVADTVLAGLASPVVIDDREIPVSASIGAVVAGLGGARSEILLDAADRELYRAKKDGKDRWALCVLDTESLSGGPNR